MGEMESLGICKAGQAVLARLMEYHIWQQPTSSVGAGFSKGTMASVCLDARHFSLSLYATCIFQAAVPVLELRGSKSELVSPCVGSLRGTAWGSRSFFHRLNPCWFLQTEIVGTYLPGTGSLGWRASWGLGLLTAEISLPYFYPPHVGDGPARSTSASRPVWMDVVSLIP